MYILTALFLTFMCLESCIVQKQGFQCLELSGVRGRRSSKEKGSCNPSRLLSWCIWCMWLCAYMYVTFAIYILHTCSKCFTCICFFSPLSITLWRQVVLSPFYRWRNQGTERIGHLPKVTELGYMCSSTSELIQICIVNHLNTLLKCFSTNVYLLPGDLDSLYFLGSVSNRLSTK